MGPYPTKFIAIFATSHVRNGSLTIIWMRWRGMKLGVCIEQWRSVVTLFGVFFMLNPFGPPRKMSNWNIAFQSHLVYARTIGWGNSQLFSSPVRSIRKINMIALAIPSTFLWTLCREIDICFLYAFLVLTIFSYNSWAQDGYTRIHVDAFTCQFTLNYLWILKSDSFWWSCVSDSTLYSTFDYYWFGLFIFYKIMRDLFSSGLWIPTSPAHESSKFMCKVHVFMA